MDVDMQEGSLWGAGAFKQGVRVGGAPGAAGAAVSCAVLERSCVRPAAEARLRSGTRQASNRCPAECAGEVDAVVQDMLQGGALQAHAHGEGEGGDGCPACGSSDLDSEPAAKVGARRRLLLCACCVRTLPGTCAACPCDHPGLPRVCSAGVPVAAPPGRRPPAQLHHRALLRPRIGQGYHGCVPVGPAVGSGALPAARTQRQAQVGQAGGGIRTHPCPPHLLCPPRTQAATRWRACLTRE